MYILSLSPCRCGQLPLIICFTPSSPILHSSIYMCIYVCDVPMSSHYSYGILHFVSILAPVLPMLLHSIYINIYI